jgi:hypothetical protein
MRFLKITKVWFDFLEDPDKSSFEIKNITAGEAHEIEEKTQNTSFELKPAKGKKGKPGVVPTLKIKKREETILTIIAVVAGWKNVFNNSGAKLKCTDENKKRLCKELSEADFYMFTKFINRCREELDIIVKQEEEKALGN